MSTASWIGQELGAGRYRVTARLGEGGMGYVYRAHDRNLDTDVVIKVPRTSMLEDADFSERFNREIRSLVRLAHPHVVKIMDVGNQDGAPYAVMQYLPGGSLKDRLTRDADGKPLPMRPEEVLEWLPGLASALDFVHGQGYLHRDIKPANILFDEHGHVYLSDFGVVKAILASNQSAPTATLTGTGVIVGTPEYMAPELLMGQPYDGRADQYALGITVYEMLGGRRPFEGATPAAIVMQHVSQPPPPLTELNAELPPAVFQVVARALSKDPAKRYPSCTAFAQALAEAFRGGMSAPAGQATGTTSVIMRQPCPTCNRPLALGEKTRGRRIRCPGCQAIWRVADDLKQLLPTAPSTPEVETRSAPRTEIPVAPPPVPTEKLSGRKPKPIRRKRQGPKTALLVIGGILIAVLAALGTGLAVLAAVVWWPRAAISGTQVAKSGTPTTAVAPAPAPAPRPGPGQVPVPPVEDLPGVVVSQVPGQGRYRSIGEALREVEPGTRIKVRPGIYTESLEIDKRVEIVGEGPVNQIVLQNGDANCLAMKTDQATVRGLTIRGNAGLKGANLYTINIGEGQLVLENCDITSDSLACVAIHGATTRPTFRNCRIHDGKSGGLFFYDNAHGLVDRCEIDGHALACVEIREGADPVLRGCRIHDGRQGGVLVHTNARSTLEDCDITDNFSAGVSIRERGDPTIRNCRIRRNKTQGIAVISDGSATVEDCDLTQNEAGSWRIDADCEVRRLRNKEDAGN
jgi:serine/threonine-protein kinase